MVYPSSSFTKPFMDTVVKSSPKEIRSTRFSTLLTAFAKLTFIDVVGFDSIYLITFSTALDSFFPKYHARKHRRVISSPPFYTHIFYNPWTLKEDIARDNSVRGYALVKHTISPHAGTLHGGVVKEILYRYDLPNQENQFVQK